MATIYEVAKLAGVSLATVSRVINNSGKVTSATRGKVEAAMRELGYRPNAIAQSLASSRSNSVGLLVPELHGPFFGIMMSSIEDELRASGKHLIISAGHSDERKERESIEFLISRQCDALILHCFAVPNEYLLGLAQSQLAVFVIGRDIPDLSDRCFYLDNEAGSYLATRALIELGHHNLAYLAGPLWKSDAKARYQGFRRALDEAGLTFHEELLTEGNYQEVTGREGMRQLLRTGTPFSGIVCANDEMAVGVIEEARQRGMSIPEDLSVIGFDNVFFTRYMNPALSTVNYPVDLMGRMAAKCVLREVYDQNEVDVETRYQPRLVMRASTTAYRG
jgi:LacI family transcriptional regulator